LFSIKRRGANDGVVLQKRGIEEVQKDDELKDSRSPTPVPAPAPKKGAKKKKT